MYVDNVFLIGSDWQPGMNKATICFRIPVRFQKKEKLQFSFKLTFVLPVA